MLQIVKTHSSLIYYLKIFVLFSRMIVIPFKDIEKYQHKTLDSGFNGVVFAYEAQVIYQNYINRKSFSFLTCKERLVNNQLVFYLHKNHYLTDKFYEKIEWLRERGLTNYIISKYVDADFRNRPKQEKDKEAMSFHELSATFGVWLGGMSLALIIFICEILCRVKARKKWDFS